jgi:hypothetical protein
VRPFIVAFCVCLISAAGADRSLIIRNAQSRQSQQELATVLRSILEIPNVDVDTDRQTLAISGTDGQIRAAEWLLSEMDRPATAPDAKPWASGIYRGGGNNSGDDSSGSGLAGDIIRVFYVHGGRSLQDFQEGATALRSILEIRRLFTYNQVGGIAVRGTPAQVEAAEWVWRVLESDGNPSTSNLEELRAALPGESQLLRAYRMPMAWPIPDLQEAATVLRSIVELRWVYTYNRTRTIFIRGDEGGIAAANWMAVESTRPASQELAQSEPFRMQDPRQEGSLRVFRLPAGKYSIAEFQRLAVDVRTQAQIRRLFTFNTPRMIAVRGTEAQIALTQQLLGAAR